MRKTAPGILLMQGLQAFVLRCVSAFAGDIDDQDDVALILRQVHRLPIETVHREDSIRYSPQLSPEV